MTRVGMNLRRFAGVAGLIALAVAGPARAPQPGGRVRVAHRDSPASMSTLEEVTISTVAPMMGVFNNLVLFDQHVPQNTLQSIVPDLATDWSWNEDGTELTFRLRRGARWHDGQPFTANDVQCTWDMLVGRSTAKFRINPRRSWYWNLDRVTTNSDYEATFHLRQPQPALIALLASGYSGRHRMDNNSLPLDGAARLPGGKARHDLSVRGDRSIAQGHREPGSAGDL